ncbi:MAG: Gfo/Idh/MocA family oxidoreductase [Myxococcales bacterium]|nr:Gfo/Idh/MocA family oxidoreductase [Myxococcales bacterium]
MTEQPRVAVVGCGHWGKNITRNLVELGALAGVVDPSEAGRIMAEKIAPGVPIHADLDPVLRDPNIHAVMVATPPETHHAVASRVLDAGKDVYVEKPLTTDVDEAEDLVARAHRGDRVLMVGHILEYHPAILRLHELIRDGELGTLRYLTSNRLNLGRIRAEENALWSFAPHDISVILRLVGQMPFEVIATGGSYVRANVADVTVSQLLFDNGVRSHIYVSWLHPFKEQKLVVIGSQRMATFDDVAKELKLYDLEVDHEEGQPVPRKVEGKLVSFPDAEPLREECAHFLDCVARRKRPRTDGWNGLRVLQILQASQRSMITNGSPILLNQDTLVGPAGDTP